MKHALVFLLFVIFASCERQAEPQTLIGNAFGTTYSIQFFASKKLSIEAGIDSVIRAVNRSVSTYDPNSDISKINNGDSTLVVDSIFREVYFLSEEVFKKSDGYFDPTIGVLRNAYGFGEVEPLQKMDSLVLDSLLGFVGFEKVNLTGDGTIKKKSPEIYFDFNAVAKGYGVDLMGRYLEALGIENYLVEIGGELLAKGTNLHKQQPWTAGIESPETDRSERSYTAIVELKNEGMATSGNYRKFRVDSLSGKKYVHTINPLTGSAEMSDVLSASVIAPSCGLADAYATAFMAMGLEKSKKLVAELDGIEAYLLYNDSANAHQVFMTKGFEARLKKEAK